MDQFLEIIINVINQIGFWPLFIVGLLLSLFLFWKESYSHKDRNSVFDMWVLTILFSMFWARLSFIISNWEFFESLPWALAPYERYGEQIYFFRLLPWRFFDLRDGGFLFTSIFSAYILFAFLYNIFVKRWRWREMFIPVILSAEILLVFVLIVYGALAGFPDIVLGGFFIGGVILGFLVIIMFLRWMLKKNHFVEILPGLINFVVMIFILISFALITRLFLSYDISPIDRINIIIMNVTGFVVAFYFIFVEKRRKNTKESVILGGGRRSVVMNVNKPFKRKNGEN
jgi:hypothetical protein